MVNWKAKTIGGMFREGGDEAQHAASAASKERLREQMEASKERRREAFEARAAAQDAAIESGAAPIFAFTSHIEGKNAKVFIWKDRIEWERHAVSGGKMTAALLTGGTSLLFTGVRGKNTDMVPIRQVTSVVTRKGAGLNTVVSVLTAGGSLDFRVSHREAEQAKNVLNRLILEAGTPQVVVQAPAAPAALDVADQIAKFADLHRQGILTDEEFAAKKAALLA